MNMIGGNINWQIEVRIQSSTRKGEAISLENIYNCASNSQNLFFFFFGGVRGGSLPSRGICLSMLGGVFGRLNPWKEWLSLLGHYH
jgi:hypothetical protein